MCPRCPCACPQVLKILLHLCGHGSSASLLILRRNPAFIQEAAGRARGRPREGAAGAGPGSPRRASTPPPTPAVPAVLPAPPPARPEPLCTGGTARSSLGHHSQQGWGRAGPVRPLGEVGLWPVVIRRQVGLGRSPVPRPPPRPEGPLWLMDSWGCGLRVDELNRKPWPSGKKPPGHAVPGGQCRREGRVCWPLLLAGDVRQCPACPVPGLTPTPSPLFSPYCGGPGPPCPSLGDRAALQQAYRYPRCAGGWGHAHPRPAPRTCAQRQHSERLAHSLQRWVRPGPS